MPVERLKIIWYWLLRLGCRLLCVLLFRLRAQGLKNIPDTGAFLLVSNHQSFLDPIFCGVFLKRHMHYLARASLFANWFLGWLIRSLNAIPVERGKGDLSAMRTVIARLKEGKAVCLFPEGTRTSDGKIEQLMGGFGLLSRRGDAAIVPMVIEGAFECWPRQNKLFRPGRVEISYGKPIGPEQVRTMKDRQLAEFLTDTLRQMQKDLRQRLGKNPHDY
jgi:1-acyl-sn-glycerol-3-phosphate acyltransferase